MERIRTYEHYSKIRLEKIWSKTNDFMRKNLDMSCDTSERRILKKWLETNCILIISDKESDKGISLQEVAEWIKSRYA